MRCTGFPVVSLGYAERFLLLPPFTSFRVAMVIEILSPSNTEIPLLRKFTEYLKAGIREYWIIDPETKNIQAHVLEKGDKELPAQYISRVYSAVEALNVSILPGLRIDFKTIWDAIAPKT
jgi:Uma2 family endonuclease